MGAEQVTLAIDPGKHFCALALADANGTVRWAHRQMSYRAPTVPFGGLFPCDSIVLEFPQVYSGARHNDPNDLIAVMGAGAWMACAASPEIVPRMVSPNTWKGQVPKEIQHARIMKLLAPGELRAILRGLQDVPKAEQHNVWDAVGLALWAVGRLPR